MHPFSIGLASRLSLAVAVTSAFGPPAVAASTTTESLLVSAPTIAANTGIATALVASTGLDLHSGAGAAALRHRVRVGAVKVCGVVMPGEQFMSDAMRDCVGQSIAEAGPQVNFLLAEARAGRPYASIAPLVMQARMP